jgi:predicted ATP-grasp superfamily ATP-dependent carboligase
LAAHLWRRNDNWKIVGGRKAIPLESLEQIFAEYEQISSADPRVLVQEMVPGNDDQLFVAACYLDKHSNLAASFTAQKLLQSPAVFGTGCVIQAVDRPELIEPAIRVLRQMSFTGIAEVEFKYDAGSRKFKLIEINARPWDQHTLGKASGVDLIYLAYCEHAGLLMPSMKQKVSGHKWVAEDSFFMLVLRSLRKHDPKLGPLFRLARGRRIYGIWSAADKRPLVFYLFGFLPRVAWMGIRHLASDLMKQYFRRGQKDKRGISYEHPVQDSTTKN